MLIIVCGLQGVGKTTVAKKFAKQIGAIIIRSDVIRRKLKQAIRYTPLGNKLTYNKLFSAAETLLKQKKTVILDATFAKKINRTRAAKLAKKFKTKFAMIEVTCPKNLIRIRLKKRFGDASEAEFQHYLEYKKIFDKITEPHTSIDNSKTFENLQKQINAIKFTI